MFGAAFGSSIAVAGVPPIDIEFDKIGVTIAGGSAGVALGGYLGAAKGGAMLGGLVGGPLGAVAGAAVGGVGGILVGWSGLVVFKAFHNELKRR